MDLQKFKTQYFLFEPEPYGRVFAFVDFGNVRPWAKDIWTEENKFRFCVEIDIKKIYDICSWVRAKKSFFYYGYFPKDEAGNTGSEKTKKHNKSIFRIDKARKCGFEVKTKETKMIPHYDEDGKFRGKFPKCNFDVEMTMDMIMNVDNFDTIMLFSGDSDFGGLLKYLKSRGKKIVIVCTRNRMSSELEEVANKFVPAETLKDFLKYERINNTPPLRAEV